MNKYVWFVLLLSVLANFGGFFYFNARIDAKDAALALERNKVTEAVADVANLEAEVAKLVNITKLKDTEYEKAIAEYEEYKEAVANIEPRVITSIRTIIEQVPADLVVVQANETSNETLRRINASAADFKRVRNQD